MNISSSQLEDVCKSLLQRTVSFTVKNKIIKKGKIELFTQRNFHIVFHLLTNKNKKEKLEIPIPFSIEEHLDDGLLFFDYRIKSLSKYFPEAESDLVKLLEKNKSKNTKFTNNILLIENINNE
jgi:hypothetical protein